MQVPVNRFELRYKSKINSIQTQKKETLKIAKSQADLDLGRMGRSENKKGEMENVRGETDLLITMDTAFDENGKM